MPKQCCLCSKQIVKSSRQLRAVQHLETKKEQKYGRLLILGDGGGFLSLYHRLFRHFVLTSAAGMPPHTLPNLLRQNASPRTLRHVWLPS